MADADTGAGAGTVMLGTDTELLVTDFNTEAVAVATTGLGSFTLTSMM